MNIIRVHRDTIILQPFMEKGIFFGICRSLEPLMKTPRFVYNSSHSSQVFMNAFEDSTAIHTVINIYIVLWQLITYNLFQNTDT